MTTERPDVELLADLDAGLLHGQRAAEVRAAALADPAAAAVLAALAATRAELATLVDPPVPPEIAARWAAALDTAAHTAALDTSALHTPALDIVPPADTPPVSPSAVGPAHQDARVASAVDAAASRAARTAAPRPPTRRDQVAASAPGSRRRLRPRPAVVAAALLLAVLVGAALRSWSAAPQQIAGVELAAAGRAAVGVGDSGELADPGRRAGCLRAVSAPGVRPDALLLGGRQVTFDGTPATLLVLAIGELGAFRVVVVNPGCGPGGGTLLGSVRVGP